MTMRLTCDGDWHATVTDEPLPIAPRFTSDSVDVTPCADVREREQFLAHTFGSQDRLWDTPDVLRFDPASRELVGAELQMPYVSASAETSTRLPVLPAVRPGGLRADEVRDFRQETCTATTWWTANPPPWPGSARPTSPCAPSARTGTGPTRCSR
jgi:hypothetical protein